MTVTQRRKPAVIALFMSWLLACGMVAAIDCDSALVQPQAWGYKKRGADRCEGQYFKQTGVDTSSKLRVISLMDRFGDFDPLSDGVVVVEWTPPGKASRVRLTAQSLKPSQYYQMDAEIEPGRVSYNWPTDVLRDERLRVRRRDLVVVARTADGVLLPVTLRRAQDRPPAQRQPFLVIVPTTDATEIFVSVSALDAARKVKRKIAVDQPLRQAAYPKDLEVTIPLPLVERGLYQVHLGARLAAGGPASLPLLVYYAGHAQ